jgi:hypothetical protein
MVSLSPPLHCVLFALSFAWDFCMEFDLDLDLSVDVKEKNEWPITDWNRKCRSDKLRWLSMVGVCWVTGGGWDDMLWRERW